MADPETRGQRLRARRVELDLTLAEVAERSGLSLPYVSNLERGRGNPTEDALRALAEGLDLPLVAVIGESHDPDNIGTVLADAPRSLLAFAKTSRFRDAVARLAEQQQTDAEEMRRRLLVGMASAPSP